MTRANLGLLGRALSGASGLVAAFACQGILGIEEGTLRALGEDAGSVGGSSFQGTGGTGGLGAGGTGGLGTGGTGGLATGGATNAGGTCAKEYCVTALPTPGTCAGTCRGSCDGQCAVGDPSPINPSSDCFGPCTGLCQGTCIEDNPPTCAGTIECAAIADYGDPCTEAGKGACFGTTDARQLVCNGQEWVPNGSCITDYFCDSLPGPSAGSCYPKQRGCDGLSGGATFCASADMRVACGPDLITAFPAPCPPETPSCNGGTCGTCVNSSSRCSGISQELCIDGNWVLFDCAPGSCSVTTGYCGCANGERRCSQFPNGIDECFGGDWWLNYGSCGPAQYCSDGVCYMNADAGGGSPSDASAD